MRKDRVAVMGDKDNVLAFKSIGFDVYAVQDVNEGREKLKALAMNYKIIYVTEDYAIPLSDLIDKYKSKPYPIVLSFPTSTSNSGYGIDSIHKNVEKAIGTDILFKDKK